MAIWRHTLHAGIFDDTFWALANERWMLDHHRVMTRDIFSYAVHGHPWITPEYGYDLVLAGGVQMLGAGWFWFLRGGLATLAVARPCPPGPGSSALAGSGRACWLSGRVW